MKDSLKTIQEMLKSEIKKYETEHKDGMKMTDKDPERLAHLSMALTFSKMLCMLEEVEEKGLSAILKGKSGEDGGKKEDGIGFQKMPSNSGWNPLEMLHNIPGFEPMHHSPMGSYNSPQNGYDMNDTEMRRGVPGSGRGGNRGGRRRNGQGQYMNGDYDTSSNYDSYDSYEDMEDSYSSPQNAQGGSSGGRGNSGGRGGNTSPQNNTVTTGQPVGPVRG